MSTELLIWLCFMGVFILFGFFKMLEWYFEKPNNIWKRIRRVSKNTGVRQNRTKENLPERVYIVTDITNRWVCGCFYERGKAVSYTGGLDRYSIQEFPIE